MVDLGCIFIGHGLSKDFRTISESAGPQPPLTEDIFVPPEQVLDTVNLYTVPGRSRKLSLRFLTWFLLKTDIQTSEHDSIEDARHAYLLYKKYKHFEEEDRFEDVMEDIFAEGHKTGFKPRSEVDRPSTPAGAFPPLQAPQAQSPASSAAAAAAAPGQQLRAGAGRHKALAAPAPGSGASPLARQQWSTPPQSFVPGQRRW